MNIVIKEFPDRQFASKEDMFTALRENKSFLIAQKKSIVKHADPVFADVLEGENIFSDKYNLGFIIVFAVPAKLFLLHLY